jgi:hypothetical protein
MPVWLSRLLQDWRVIASDPESLAIAVTLAVLIGAAALYWTFASVVSSSSLFLKEAVNELGELNVGYKTLKKPVRDPNGLYREGQRIGSVLKPDVDVPKGDVKFQDVKTNGELDRTTPFEFQDLILTYKGCDVSERIRKGDDVSFRYSNARFAIAGKRVD